MKKLLIALVALVMVSCDIDPYDQTHGRNPDRATRIKVAPAMVGEFEFRGHKYIQFPTMKAVVHDPDCQCQKQTREQVDSILTLMYD